MVKDFFFICGKYFFANLYKNDHKLLYGAMFFFIVFFPWVTFRLFSSDLSPIYLAVLLNFYLFSFKKSNEISTSFFFSCFLIILNFYFYSYFLLYKFAAFLTMSNLLIHFFKQGLLNKISKNLFLITSLLWLLFGIITLLDHQFFYYLITRPSVTAGRGAIGIASEPAFYGTSSAFLYAISYILYLKNKHDLKLKFTYNFFIFSTMISLSFYAAIIQILLFLHFKRYKLLLSLLFIIGIFFLFLTYSHHEVRFFTLLKYLIAGDFIKFFNDESVFLRFSNLLSLRDMLIINPNYPLPIYDKWGDIQLNGLSIIIYTFRNLYIWPVIIFLFFRYTYWKFLLDYSKHSFSLISILSIFILFGPLSNPFYWIFIGCLHFYREILRKE